MGDLLSEFYEAVADTLDELVDGIVEYLVADKLITIYGDDIVKHNAPERLN